MKKRPVNQAPINISNKLQLHQRFGDVIQNNILEHHSVQDWIFLYPIYVYRRVYCSTKYKLKPLELRLEAVALLKEQLALHHPELLAEIEYRKHRHQLKSAVGINLKKR
jgi:hypothetical protein